MNRAITAASLGVLICFSGMSWAGDDQKHNSSASGASASSDVLFSLEAVQWVGPGITFHALEGKTTVVLVYATWCPICNKWSGKMFAQLKDAIKGRPVVVLAVNTDKTPRSARRYVVERDFKASNIIHGYHPTLHTRLGFDSNLFHYMQIGPNGKIIQKGSAGMYDQDGNFGLPTRLKESESLGQFLFIAPEMPDAFQTLLWPCELGQMSDIELRAAQKKLPADQKKAIETAVDRFLDTRLEQIRRYYKGSIPERLEAHQAAGELSKMFKSSEQSKKAKQVIAFMEKDKQFKQELAARKAYQSALERIAAKPQRRNSLFKAIARRFQGTHFGNIAKESLEHTGIK